MLYTIVVLFHFSFRPKIQYIHERIKSIHSFYENGHATCGYGLQHVKSVVFIEYNIQPYLPIYSPKKIFFFIKFCIITEIKRSDIVVH